ncbi:MAG: DUF2846 domain-containing protein [Magnetococcus sp. DMHC-6]
MSFSRIFLCLLVVLLGLVTRSGLAVNQKASIVESLLKPSPGKAVIYFLFDNTTDEDFEAQIYLDSDKLDGFPDDHWFRKEVEPGRLMIKSRIERIGIFHFLEMNVSSGSIYFIRHMVKKKPMEIRKLVYYPVLWFSCAATFGNSEACDMRKNWFLEESLTELTDVKAALQEINSLDFHASPGED